MDAYSEFLNNLVNNNRSEYGQLGNIKWANPYNSSDAISRRTELLARACTGALYKDTKPYYRNISRGCQLCGSGEWSCLFITGRCNASCFYCPVRQDSDDIPTSQRLIFNRAGSYVDYINYMKFKGISFSGGEPLLQYKRVLEYLEAIRAKCDPGIYTWLYTNGMEGDESVYRELALRGLNEIRFNIGATNYHINTLKKASGIIPVITVEIPAIPEDSKVLVKLLPELIESGVHHLNLHQLRLTVYNARHILERGYTLVPAEKPVVLESELAALEIINQASAGSLDIGINYCSFMFKNRFQKAGYRRKMAKVIGIPDEKLTENGYIRDTGHNFIKYSGTVLREYNHEYTGGVKKVTELEGRKYILDVLPSLQYTGLSREKMDEVMHLVEKEPEEIPADPILFETWRHEYIEKGLRE